MQVEEVGAILLDDIADFELRDLARPHARQEHDDVAPTDVVLNEVVARLPRITGEPSRKGRHAHDGFDLLVGKRVTFHGNKVLVGHDDIDRDLPVRMTPRFAPAKKAVQPRPVPVSKRRPGQSFEIVSAMLPRVAIPSPKRANSISGKTIAVRDGGELSPKSMEVFIAVGCYRVIAKQGDHEFDIDADVALGNVVASGLPLLRKEFGEQIGRRLCSCSSTNPLRLGS